MKLNENKSQVDDHFGQWVCHILKTQKLLQDFLGSKNLRWTLNTDEAIAYGRSPGNHCS